MNLNPTTDLLRLRRLGVGVRLGQQAVGQRGNASLVPDLAETRAKPGRPWLQLNLWDRRWVDTITFRIPRENYTKFPLDVNVNGVESVVEYKDNKWSKASCFLCVMAVTV